VKKAISMCLATAAVVFALGAGAGSAQAANTVFCKTNASHTCAAADQYQKNQVYKSTSGDGMFIFGTHTVDCNNLIEFESTAVSAPILESKILSYTLSSCSDGAAACTASISGGPFSGDTVWTPGTDSGSFKIVPAFKGTPPVYEFSCSGPPLYTCSYTASAVPMKLIGGTGAFLEGSATLTQVPSSGPCASVATYKPTIKITSPSFLFVEEA
jgi:hypothetical protein